MSINETLDEQRMQQSVNNAEIINFAFATSASPNGGDESKMTL